MIYYIIIYILRRGRKGRQKDNKTVSCWGLSDFTLYRFPGISEKATFSQIQWLKCLSIQQDKKTTRQCLAGDLQISPDIDSQE